MMDGRRPPPPKVVFERQDHVSKSFGALKGGEARLTDARRRGRHLRKVVSRCFCWQSCAKMSWILMSLVSKSFRFVWRVLFFALLFWRHEEIQPFPSRWWDLTYFSEVFLIQVPFVSTFVQFWWQLDPRWLTAVFAPAVNKGDESSPECFGRWPEDWVSRKDGWLSRRPLTIQQLWKVERRDD